MLSVNYIFGAYYLLLKICINLKYNKNLAFVSILILKKTLLAVCLIIVKPLATILILPLHNTM